MKNKFVSALLIFFAGVATAAAPIDTTGDMHQGSAKVYDRLDSAVVKHQGVKQDSDASGDVFATLVEPQIKYVRSSVAAGKVAAKTIEMSGLQGRVFSNNDVALWDGSVVTIQGVAKFSANRVMVTSNGKEMLFGDNQEVVMERDNRHSLAKGIPGDDPRYTIIPQPQKYSCSGGNLFSNGNKVPGNSASFRVPGMCFDTVLTIGCDGDGLTVGSYEIFNGCRGFTNP
jgi:hypothetical protein